MPLLFLIALFLSSCAQYETAKPDTVVHSDVNIRLHISSGDIKKLAKGSPKSNLPANVKDSISRLSHLSKRAKKTKSEEVETKDFATFRCEPLQCTVDLVFKDEVIPNEFLGSFIEEMTRIAMKTSP